MKFEIGKKYQRKGTNRLPLTCIGITLYGNPILQRESQYSYEELLASDHEDYAEYYEPVKYTRDVWFPVVVNPPDESNFGTIGTYLFGTEAVGRHWSSRKSDTCSVHYRVTVEEVVE